MRPSRAPGGLLPRTTNRSSPCAPTLAPAMTKPSSTGEPAAPRVLVVDDHRLFRGGLRDVLEESGIGIAGEADSGEEAVELAAALSPDVVIMDLKLPGISGAEA